MNANVATFEVGTEPEGVELRILAQRVAHELAAAAAIAHDCQEVVGEMASHGLASELVVRLQALDSLTQRLGQLGALFERLAALPDVGHAPEHVFEDIRLDGLRLRLWGRTDHGAVPDGEPELW
jgi:hypothetical protein